MSTSFIKFIIIIRIAKDDINRTRDFLNVYKKLAVIAKTNTRIAKTKSIIFSIDSLSESSKAYLIRNKILI